MIIEHRKSLLICGWFKLPSQYVLCKTPEPSIRRTAVRGSECPRWVRCMVIASRSRKSRIARSMITVCVAQVRSMNSPLRSVYGVVCIHMYVCMYECMHLYCWTIEIERDVLDVLSIYHLSRSWWSPPVVLCMVRLYVRCGVDARDVSSANRLLWWAIHATWVWIWQRTKTYGVLKNICSRLGRLAVCVFFGFNVRIYYRALVCCSTVWWILSERRTFTLCDE